MSKIEFAFGQYGGRRARTHGETKTPTYNSWKSMIHRCYREDNASYKNYGAKGIGVCKRWHKYENFKKDMGERPSGHTLDRIDSSKNYSPSNCRWATRIEQNSNRKGQILITAFGKTKNINAWARELGINKRTIRERFYYGWSHEDCLFKGDKRWR